MGSTRHPAARGIVALALVATMLGGCTGAPSIGGGLAGVTGYTAGNAFLAAGYRSKEIDATHHLVTVTGTPETPRARLEKIAMARAAEIGKEGKHAAFKVDSVEPSVVCGKKIDGYKTPTASPPDYARLAMTVSYAPVATDPTWLPTSETFDRLTAELASDVVAGEDGAASAREVRAACGRK